MSYTHWQSSTDLGSRILGFLNEEEGGLVIIVHPPSGAAEVDYFSARIPAHGGRELVIPGRDEEQVLVHCWEYYWELLQAQVMSYDWWARNLFLRDQYKFYKQKRDKWEAWGHKNRVLGMTYLYLSKVRHA